MTDLPFPRVSSAAPADASVRPARPGDAEAIADVQLTVWRAGYADVLPDLTELDGDDVAEQWRTSITAPPSTHHVVLVALAGDAVVGFAVAGPVPEDSGSPSAVGEILDLLVRPEHTCAGHGSRLLAATVDRLRERGDREVLVWCGQADDARRSFLESAGFAPDGVARTLDMGAGTPALTEVRLGALLD